jgi:eukaryotic-like serine/threonine-protein kinase
MTDTASNPSAENVEADLCGRQLGDFHLLRRLGRGAMAEVYLAEQGSLRRQVAIKVLKSDLAKDETYVKRFHNEAQAAASLVHANIVQIHEVGCVDGIHYIAQEYVQGQNLREWTARRGPPDLRMAVTIMRQVAAALHKAAGQGIVHRDIKPENIMLARTGEVKVADFGLARLAGDGAAMNLTQVGITMGTPLYMSPEQVEGRPLDPRSDIYSFGVTCYQMLAGVTPFRGDTALSVALQHLKSQPDRLENLRPDLPVALSRIVHKMLAKDPAHRYATSRDLLRDLRALRLEDDGEWPDDGSDLADVDAEPLSARGEATQRLDALMKTSGMGSVRRRPLVWAVACLAALTAGGGLAWFNREPFLLADTGKDGVTGYDTARELFTAAQFQTIDSEAGYRGVIEHFPKDRYFVPRAKQELAWLYLTKGRRDEALALFEELAVSDEAESRAFGLAGEGVILTLQGDYPHAAQALAQLPGLRGKIDRRMFPLIQRAIVNNQKHLSEQTRDDLEELIKQMPGEEEFAPTSDDSPQPRRDNGPPSGRQRP